MNQPTFQYDPKGHSQQLYYSRHKIMNWVHAAHINEAVRRAKLSQHDYVLDVGCSDGEFFYRLHDDYRLAVGLDHNRDALETLTRRMNNGKTGVLTGDACRLPFPDETFDAVCCLETLEHVYDMPAAVADLTRILKPDGVLIVTVPIERGLSILLKQGVSKVCFGGYRGSYTWAELMNATVGRLDRVERVSLSSHKGFDYMTVVHEISARFHEVRRCGLPFKPLYTVLNTQVLIEARKKK
ncbi:MAG: methyltransferase domain-containing protein [bacterium]|nr:methyltransferase domain-containing protein [bacterium]